MAEAHARLGLRAEVTPNDALVAITLYEQALVSLFGPTFQAPPPPLSGVDFSKSNIQQSVDNYMQTTAQWLHGFIKNLLGDQC
jgi:DNA replicative helicase MCM subunit Mcm2 (Cdc46/Mcm family)